MQHNQLKIPCNTRVALYGPEICEMNLNEIKSNAAAHNGVHIIRNYTILNVTQVISYNVMTYKSTRHH